MDLTQNASKRLKAYQSQSQPPDLSKTETDDYGGINHEAVIVIKTDDALSLARAVVVAKAAADIRSFKNEKFVQMTQEQRVQRSRTWGNLRRKAQRLKEIGKAQKRKAIELLRDARISVEKSSYGPEDMEKIQTFFGNRYRLIELNTSEITANQETFDPSCWKSATHTEGELVFIINFNGTHFEAPNLYSVPPLKMDLAKEIHQPSQARTLTLFDRHTKMTDPVYMNGNIMFCLPTSNLLMAKRPSHDDCRALKKELLRLAPELSRAIINEAGARQFYHIVAPWSEIPEDLKKKFLILVDTLLAYAVVHEHHPCDNDMFNWRHAFFFTAKQLKKAQPEVSTKCVEWLQSTYDSIVGEAAEYLTKHRIPFFNGMLAFGVHYLKHGDSGNTTTVTKYLEKIEEVLNNGIRTDDNYVFDGWKVYMNPQGYMTTAYKTRMKPRSKLIKLEWKTPITDPFSHFLSHEPVKLTSSPSLTIADAKLKAKQVAVLW
ncbi:hypothetical protein QR680_011746 [Steinernema hermaphroditum]|uniref:Uncharacterized protein n=1 Tax=Steinernema hermaphroditum TaxID=289476 RepID=A0AA39LZ94_9BILA|nr:hypothetical protein QR680_011746 [Steinernema hermaphroditum]